MDEPEVIRLNRQCPEQPVTRRVVESNGSHVVWMPCKLADCGDRRSTAEFTTPAGRVPYVRRSVHRETPSWAQPLFQGMCLFRACSRNGSIVERSRPQPGNVRALLDLYGASLQWSTTTRSLYDIRASS